MRRGTPPLVKITPPVLDRVFPRSRLFRLLDRARKRPVVWISGPPGCGKTTLAAGYLASRKVPCLWYQVDEGDRDLASFFYYMGLASKRAAPRRRTPLPLLTPEYLPGLSTFTRRFFENLCGRLKPGSVIVLDNCQNVPPESPFFEVVREGLSVLPAGIQAFLVSRSDPPPAFARKRVHGRMGEIGWKDLRLTAGETKGIARLRGRKRRGGEEIRYLQERSGGWTAGLMLLLERGGTGETDPPRLKDHAPQELFDYFGTEIFERLDGAARTFLLRSAFLPRMTARMAQRMTRHKQAGLVLSYLSRHNYFTERHPFPDPVYEYHSLFREFLLSRAGKELSGKETTLLRKAAAAVLEETGYAEEAASLHAEDGDWVGLSRVILSRAPMLAEQGRFRTLAGWLSALPEEVLRGDPWLVYWLGACRMPFDPVKSRVAFEEAFGAFRKRKDAPGTFLAWSGVVWAIAIGLEGIEPLDEWYSVLEKIVSEFGGFPSPEIEMRVLTGMMQGLGFRQPRHFDMEKWVDRALAVAQAAPNDRGSVELLAHIALVWSHVGEIDKCDALVASLEKLLKQTGISPLVRLNAVFARSTSFYFRAEYDRCLEAVSAGLSHAKETGVHLLDVILFGHGVLASLQLGDRDGAIRFLERMEPLARTVGVGFSFYHYLAAWIALEKGSRPEAMSHWEKGDRFNPTCGNPIVMVLNSVLAAYLHHGSGDREKALRHLAEARRTANEHKDRSCHFVSSLMEAFLFLDRGDESRGLAALREGFRIAREGGLFGIFLHCSGFLETLCARALEEGIEVDHVREMIRRNRLLPPKDRTDIEAWPWPLAVNTLGRFGLIKDGSPLPPSRKAPQKPLQMLKLLIAHGGRDLPVERIADALWPEADGDLAHNAYTTTLHRLRKLIGVEQALVARERSLTLSDRHCRVDAWAFEQTAEQTATVRKEGAGEEAYLRLAEKAIGLYRGPFLGEEDFAPPIIEFRDRLRSRFVQCVAILGRSREAAGEWDGAIELYRKGLEADDLSEELHRRLIHCCLRTGRHSDALVAYRRCRDTLAVRLGRAPSPETEAVAKGLLERV